MRVDECVASGASEQQIKTAALQAALLTNQNSSITSSATY
jgi:hypothetical protein